MNWNITELEKYFNETKIPEGPIKLFHATILDPKKFVESHLAVCKNNLNNKTFLPYYERLLKFREYLENEATRNP